LYHGGPAGHGTCLKVEWLWMTVEIGADSFSLMAVLPFRAVSQEAEVMDAHEAIGEQA
jgi:hypothetical protein